MDSVVGLAKTSGADPECFAPVFARPSSAFPSDMPFQVCIFANLRSCSSCLAKLYPHRPQTDSKRFVWTNVRQKTFLVTPYLCMLPKLLG